MYTVDPCCRSAAVVGLCQKSYLVVDLLAHTCWHQASMAKRAASIIITPMVLSNQARSLLKALCQWIETMAVVSINLSTYTWDDTKFCHVKLRCSSAAFTTVTMTWLHKKGVLAHVDCNGRLKVHHLHTRAPLSTQWFCNHKVSEWLVVKNDPVA